MELFLLFPDLGSKNFFYKRFPIFTKDSGISFKNRKWNYLNRISNYFSYFQTLQQKTLKKKDSETIFRNRKWNNLNRKWNNLNRKWNYFFYTIFTKTFPSLPRTPKPFLETEKGIIQTEEMDYFYCF